MLPDDTFFLSVRELAAKIKAHKMGPVELTKGYLARLEKFGAKLGAVATITRDLALQQAKQAEQEIAAGRYRGPLHGIPYGAKDLLATKGIKTTWGAPPFRDQVLKYDATVIQKLRDAGAILVAKLAMIELAGAGGYSSPAASLQGATRCPHNMDHWAGGSSSGPAAAVAAGLVGFAIGSETRGSIITPSSFSGVSGLRPTYGRVSRYGAMPVAWTMDKLGPMCRTAWDCQTVLAAIAGFDSQDTSTIRAPYAPKPPRREIKGRATLEGRRLGVVRPDFHAAGDAEIEKLFNGALETLRGLGAKLEEISLPDHPYGAAAQAILAGEAASIFRPLIESEKFQQLVDESQKSGLTAALKLPASDYLDACRMRTLIQSDLGKVFERFDVLVAPSTRFAATRIDADLAKIGAKKEEAKPAAPAESKSAADDRHNIVSASNLAGLPAISVPCGFTKENLPAGIQFVADAFNDDTTIGFARDFQKVTEWHQRRPAGF
jgi:aspartyl-tRNA(Asn)/glutamyl-tRNA(Gln) amidotransferase subunit A